MSTRRSLTGCVLLSLAGLVALPGCVVVSHHHYDEGYYDRDHHRYWHDNAWHECADHDEHCR